MALADGFPQGIGSRYTRRWSDFLARPRHTTVKQMLGWVGLAWLSATWLQWSVVSLRIHSLVGAYEAAHGPARAQWEGRAPRSLQLDQLKASLEALPMGGATLVALVLFPISLLVLFGFWVGCTRWAFGHRSVAWRRTFVTAALVVLAQTILLYPAIDDYTSITG